MADQPIFKWRQGKIECALWQGEWEGKPTYSYSINKNYFSKKKDKWETTKYFTIVDLRDLVMVVLSIIMQSIKPKKVEPKPEPKPADAIVTQPGAETEEEHEMPF